MLSKIDPEKKKIIRKWVFDIGYENALIHLKEEHDKCFVNMGTEKKYDNKRMDRFNEIVSAIHYVEFLKNTDAKQLSIF